LNLHANTLLTPNARAQAVGVVPSKNPDHHPPYSRPLLSSER
jgi:hypothetical protein